MEGQEALSVVQQLFPGKMFGYVEQAVFLGTWEGKRYREMAQELGYEEGYLKDTGSRLWRLLSQRLGKEVTKKRLRNLLIEVSALAESRPEVDRPRPPAASNLKFPGSPLKFGSPFYIPRSPTESLAIAALQQSGSLIRIKAPWRMGKTSLINHLLGTAQQVGMHTVSLDVRQADAAVVSDLDAFLRWFCWAIGQQLGIACNFEDYWFASAGSKLSCTTLMQEQLLSAVDQPVVVAIDTVHHLVDYPDIAGNFFAMLRAWYEQARVRDTWQKLRLVLAYVSELDLPLPLHQSPFNVGLLLELPGFTWEQVIDLAQGYDLACCGIQDYSALQPLFQLIGGHPYLWHLTFYWLRSGHLSLEQIRQQATTPPGIYSEYLRRYWLYTNEHPMLMAGIQHMLTSLEPVYLKPTVMTQLKDIGLIRLQGVKATFQCELYRQYFATHLEGIGV
jgi:hypothetical protein